MQHILQYGSLLASIVALAAARPQPQQPTDAGANFQLIGNGFVGGVNVPAGPGGASTPVTPNAINGGAIAAGGINNPLTNVGGSAFGPGALAANAGAIGVPGQVDLAGNGNQGNRIGAGGGIAAYLPLGRTQVLPNQRFNINSRMLVQVSEGELLCDAGPGGNAGFPGLAGGQQGQEFLLRSGQTFRFRGVIGQGIGIGGNINQGFPVEACIAQRPSIVLAEPY